MSPPLVELGTQAVGVVPRQGVEQRLHGGGLKLLLEARLRRIVEQRLEVVGLAVDDLARAVACLESARDEHQSLDLGVGVDADSRIVARG